jgi:hypothetical protein
MVRQIVASASARPTERNADPVVSASVVAHDAGVIVRMAGESLEQVGATLREYFQPVVPLLDVDPWARKW